MKRYIKALQDIKLAFVQWPLWARLGYYDIRQRYQRSVLGPFWLTLSMGVMILGIGVLYGGLFNNPLKSYIPFISVSLILWGFMTVVIQEGATLFIDNSGVLKQISLSKTSFLLRMIWKNILILLHNAIVIFLVFIVFRIWPGWSLPIAFLGLFLLIINLGWMALLAAIISTRFRDIPPLITSILQVLFFMTPVIWHAGDLPKRLAFMTANPFYHLLEIVRAPLLDQGLQPVSIFITLVLALVGWAITFFMFSMTRHRIIYWI